MTTRSSSGLVARHLARLGGWKRVATVVGGASILGVAVLFAVAWSRADLEAPAPTRLVVDRHGAFLGEVSSLSNDDRGHGYWPLEAVPERVAAATIAIEDRRFWSHPGVDAAAIGRAAWQNLRHGETVSGASTLAMQVARLQRPGRRTYARKALEAATAVCLTARHGREAVLRHYLRLVPYGNQLHGIDYAARRYLDKPVDDLSWAEIAFLAAIPQAPSRMSPFDPRGKSRAVRRGLAILDLLRDGAVLSEAEHRLARRQIRRLAIPERATRPVEAMHALLRYRAGRDAAGVEAGGARIVRSTIDLETQRAMAEIVRRGVDDWRPRGAGQGAMLVLDRADGYAVRAAVASTDWADDAHAGAIDYLRVPRSPGSALKPFVYARALDRGVLTPSTIVDDLGRGAGGITNSDGRFLGPMLPRAALATSRNVPAAELLATLGLDDAWVLLGDLGLRDGAASLHGSSHDPRRYGLGLVIGSLPVTVENLARAYTALAEDGVLHEPRWTEASERSSRGRRIFSEDAARQIALFLSDPQARMPVFPRLGATEYARPVAVKTGTSSRYRDAWTVAWSARWLVAAWVGHHDHRPMAGLSGYRSAAVLVRRAMDALETDSLRDTTFAEHSFPPPRDHRPVVLCAMSGARADAACPSATAEWLSPTEADRLGACTVHRHVAVDARNGLLATARTPTDHVELRSVAALPPRYASWAASVDLPTAPRAASLLGGSTLASVGSAAADVGTPARDADARVVAPRPEQRFFLDPEAPPGRSTVALRAVVDPPTAQLLWRVDGEPWKLVDHPYDARWPLEAGDHVIQAEVPWSGRRSAPITIRVE